jgi:hypothetical protein
MTRRRGVLGPKLFTLEEAEAALPAVTDCLLRFQAAQARFEEIGRDLAVLRLVAASGSSEENPDAHALGVKEREQAVLFESLKAVQRELLLLGCVPKSYPDGLVDFFALKEGRLVFLCWKLGEEGIQAWHSLEGGFANRMPIAAFRQKPAESS